MPGDDTTRTQIEIALRQSEERLRRVIDASPTAMVMINKDGLMEMVNTEAEKVFGYSRKEMLGQPVEMLIPDKFRSGHPSLRQMFYLDPQSRRMGAGRDLYALRKDLSEFPVEIGLNPIETEDGTLVLSAIVDITDRKQKEQRIEAALKEKDVLLREIHHRVKNNLQIIDSLLNLQAARIVDSNVQEMLRESQNRIRSMALIHQTLYQSNDFAEVDFRLFLQSLVHTLASSHGVDPERIQITVEAEPVTLPIDLAIPCGLAVNELITNALKHAFPKERSGHVVTSLKLDVNGRVLVSVTDDGVGMPANINIATTPTLGLQLVTLLADQLGGTVDMDTSGNTRFSLNFPRTK
ncbi:MAG: histidine kinase dimerization/phosphoacceptor domain -containing protein [Pseudomonadota bacterium]